MIGSLLKLWENEKKTKNHCNAFTFVNEINFVHFITTEIIKTVKLIVRK
jgi:hypothetical protein